MAAACGPGRLLPPGRAVRLERPGLHAHQRAHPRPRAPFPDQPLRADVRRDHGFQPRQGGPGLQQADRVAPPREPGRLRDPKRDPRRARGRAMRAAHAHAGRHRGQRAAGRRAAHQPAIDLRAGLAGLPRLRGRGDPRRREGAPAGRPGQRQLPDAAQPRPADRGPLDRRRLPRDVHLREHLPDPDRGAGRWRPAGAGGSRHPGRRGPRLARADRRPGWPLRVARCCAGSTGWTPATRTDQNRAGGARRCAASAPAQPPAHARPAPARGCRPAARPPGR